MGLTPYVVDMQYIIQQWANWLRRPQIVLRVVRRTHGCRVFVKEGYQGICKKSAVLSVENEPKLSPKKCMSLKYHSIYLLKKKPLKNWTKYSLLWLAKCYENFLKFVMAGLKKKLYLATNGPVGRSLPMRCVYSQRTVDYKSMLGCTAVHASNHVFMMRKEDMQERRGGHWGYWKRTFQIMQELFKREG